MTVHNFVASFQLGETKTTPKNCQAADLIYYARERFGFTLIETGNALKRVCPNCHR